MHVFVFPASYKDTDKPRQDFPSLSFGNSIADPHYVAGVGTGACSGAYGIGLDVPTAANGFVEVATALQCGGQTGKRNAPFNFVVGNTQLTVCILYNLNDGSNDYEIICGTSQGTVNNCGNDFLQQNAGTYPNAYLSTPTFTFVPN